MAVPRETFFETDEFTRRQSAVQEALMTRGVDLLVACSPVNICYLNAYVSVNVYNMMFLAVPVQGRPVFYLWQFERGRAESSVTGSETVCWETGDDPIAFVVEDLARRRLSFGHTVNVLVRLTVMGHGSTPLPREARTWQSLDPCARPSSILP